jgi:O-antigen/teichoic acid export membrane protein
MGTLTLGAGAARLIGFASIPVLTRLYSPEDFGVLAIFTAFVALLLPIVTLRYVVAVPLPRHDGMAMNLMALSAALMLTMSLMIGAGLWALGPIVFGLLSMDVLAPYWWLIILGIMGAGTYELLSMWATRRRAYPVIAQTQVLQSTTGALVKIGLGLFALKPLGLLLGQIVAQSGGIGSFVTRFRTDFRRSSTHINRRRVAFLARFYRGFPIYRLPSQLLLVFSVKAPLLFAAIVYDVETTGQLGLALMALALPMSLFGTTISKPYYAEVAQFGRKEAAKIRKLTIAIVKRLFLFSLIPAMALFFSGPTLFQLAFGDRWLLGGEIASILSLYLVAQFVVSPIVQALNVFGRQSLYLQLNVQRILLLIALFGIVGYWQIDVLAAMMAYSVLMTLYYIYTFSRVLGCIREGV